MIEIKYEVMLSAKDYMKLSKKAIPLEWSDFKYSEEIFYERKDGIDPDIVKLIKYRIENLFGELKIGGILDFSESLFLRYPGLG